MVKLRFAPSPTGFLHVGNARIALLNWLFARKYHGHFLLRLDDTDVDRGRSDYAEAIETDLRWLGLDWDSFFRQSDRHHHYQQAIDSLKAKGRLYPCFETPAELALKRKVLLGRGLPPVYDRSALDLSPDEIAKRIANGEPHHWRFRLADKQVSWQDGGRGAIEFAPGHLSDPVLVREDGRVLYTLSSVVDDGLEQVTHILRGEDHVTNTAVQIDLFQTLGHAVPEFIHLPLMLGGDGEKLSKRLGGLSLGELCQSGIEPWALVLTLAHLGTSTAPRGNESLAEIMANLEFSHFGRAAPRFDEAHLEQVNQAVLHHTPFSTVAARLATWLPPSLPAKEAEAFWLCVRGNLRHIQDCEDWATICFSDSMSFDKGMILAPEDKDYIKTALAIMPCEPWNASTIYDEWLASVKVATGRKGKSLFQPLRLALSGLDHGPEMRGLLPLIGYQRAVARLKEASR